MAKTISVRLDDEAQRALRVLEATGFSQSEAIRSALLASAVRLRRQGKLAAEVAALEADDLDRAEMSSIAALPGHRARLDVTPRTRSADVWLDNRIPCGQ